MRYELMALLMGILLARAAAAQAKDALGEALPAGAAQRLGTLRLRCSPADFCYLPDGRAALLVGGKLEIWDMARGERLEQQTVANASPATLVLRRDGQTLLIADAGGRALEWDLAAKKELRRWDTGQAGLRFACYSPDEKRVLTTGRIPPTLKEWDLETGKELIAITGKMAYFQKGLYAGDGKTALVGGGYDNILEHYDLATGQLLKQWSGDYCVYNMVLSVDGQRLLAGTRSMATEWGIPGYKRLRDFRGHHGGAVTSEAYGVNPDELLTGSRDGSIRRWNRLTGEILLRWFPHPSYTTLMKVSPDGKWVLSYGAGFVTETSLETGQPRLAWDRHAGSVQAAAFLPSGQQVVSGSADGTLRVWDVATGKTVRVISGANLGAYAVAVSPDGARVAAGCKDGKVREFALADGKLLRELAGHFGYVRSVAYTRDGARLLSSADDGSIRVWTDGRSEPTATLQGHRGGVLAVAVSPDDRLVLSGGRDATVRVWDAAKADSIRTMEGHRGWVECVAFLPDGKHALSAGRDGRVLRWDLGAGKTASEMAHGSWIRALACAPDGSRAFSAGDGREILCWDLKTGQKADTFAGHHGGVNALAVSPDGTKLVSGSADTTLLVWHLP